MVSLVSQPWLRNDDRGFEKIYECIGFGQAKNKNLGQRHFLCEQQQNSGW